MASRSMTAGRHSAQAVRFSAQAQAASPRDGVSARRLVVRAPRVGSDDRRSHNARRRHNEELRSQRTRRAQRTGAVAGRGVFPESGSIEAELSRVKRVRGKNAVLRRTVAALVVVAAAAVLVSTLLMPVLQVSGTSMTPTLQPGQVVLTVKTNSLSQGDLVAFYDNNDILLKRVIAGPGQWVTIDQQGKVFVDGQYVDEPYVQEPALGNPDISFPYQVPDGKYFVLGDHRATSIDSRSNQVGCVGTDQLVGKVFFSVWPFDRAGVVK